MRQWNRTSATADRHPRNMIPDPIDRTKLCTERTTVGTYIGCLKTFLQVATVRRYVIIPPTGHHIDETGVLPRSHAKSSPPFNISITMCFANQRKKLIVTDSEGQSRDTTINVCNLLCSLRYN
jgi:hypothetical protein